MTPLPPLGPPPIVLRADARTLPLADDSVDLIITSPPYFGLRSYTDGGKHYEEQIGAEATPTEFINALLDVTRECMRVLKPSGSMWVNLGDRYATAGLDVPQKSLIGVPWRYAIRCIDELGLILRAEIIWSKVNGLPESVQDRVRRSHEQWFHFTQEPRYYSAVDEVREENDPANLKHHSKYQGRYQAKAAADPKANAGTNFSANPLGKLPGSVWTVPTEPLRVPDHLGVDHFAAFPSEFPRRIISGWSLRGVCVECGEGRRPVVEKPDPRGVIRKCDSDAAEERGVSDKSWLRLSGSLRQKWQQENPAQLIGYACACPEPTAPTTPAVVLDPFGGTGTTAHVAHALGRQGISVDLSADYCRIARDPDVRGQRVAKVRGIKREKRVEVDGQDDLFAELG